MDTKDHHRVSEIIEWQKEQMIKHGYYIHGVIFDSVEYMDYHTHGLMESFNLPELQIVIPVSKDIANEIIYRVVESLKRGTMDLTSEFKYLSYMLRLNNDTRLHIKFVQLAPPDDHIVRIILSDPNRKFKGDPACERLYAEQDTFNPREVIE